MLVPHLGDLGRRHHGGGRRWGGWGGGYWGGGYPFPPEPYVVQLEPSNKYVIIDDKGKPIAIVPKVGTLPAGYTFRIANPAEAATGVPGQGMTGFGAVVPLLPSGAPLSQRPVETELSGFGDDGSLF